MKYILILSCLLFIASCKQNARDNDVSNLIIFHDGSIACKNKIIEFANTHYLKVVYNMKNINSIVLGGIKSSEYSSIKEKLLLIKCVYSVNDDQVNYLNDR